MSDLNFVWHSLKSRWLNSSLSILLTALGVSLAILITQFGSHVQNRLNSDGKGIDIVVGAKGSPLQLILSSIYHIDIPTGNIPYKSIEKLIKHPQIKTTIPLALGDNWKGYRIIGTTKDYLAHYQANLSKGRLWNREFEIVVGSSVNIKINDEFMGAHGLSETGDVHDNIKYKVVGIIEPTGTVLDRLLLTSLNSVLQIHGLNNLDYKDKTKIKREKELKSEHNHQDEEYKSSHDHQNDQELGSPEITALLITTKSPIANINLPRLINRETSLQAANPALEMARFSSMLGLGSKSFIFLSIVLISIAALSIFSGLAGNLESRMGDLAILRAIGYSKNRIFKIIVFEGMFIVISGLALGIIMGLGGYKVLSYFITPLNISGGSISLDFNLIFIILTVIIAGLLAAVFPAYLGSKISVANQLSRTL